MDGMELISNSENKKMFIEEGETIKIYMMQNIGTYDNLQGKQLYDEDNTNWKLFLYEEQSYEGEEVYRVEAKFNKNGEYNSLMIEENSMKRVLRFSNGLLFSDIVYKNNMATNQPSFDTSLSYVGFLQDEFNGPFIDFEEYMKLNKRYTSFSGEVATIYPSDEKIFEFLDISDKMENFAKIKTI